MVGSMASGASVVNDENLKKVAKHGLKVMRQTHERHPLRTEGRIIKYGTSGFARNIWLSAAATAVMTITLVISFITIVASAILTNTAEVMREKIDITIYFKPNTSSEQLKLLEDAIFGNGLTKDVEGHFAQAIR